MSSSRLRRLFDALRPLVAALALTTWGLGQASALAADTATATSAAVVHGPHVEAPGDHAEHAGHDETACRWCQALQLGAEFEGRAAVAPAPPALRGAIASDEARLASVGIVSAAARAPPVVAPTA